MPLVMGRIDCQSIVLIGRQFARLRTLWQPLTAVDVVETEDLPQVADGLHFDASGMRTWESALQMFCRARHGHGVGCGGTQGTYRSDYTGICVGYAFETDGSRLSPIWALWILG